MIDAKFDPINRDVLFQGFGTPEERSRMLADFAREQLAQAVATNRKGQPGEVAFEQFVDGRIGAALETVRPDGVIVFDFDLVRVLLEWLGEELPKASPVRSGRYANSHILLADGVEVELPGLIPEAREYVFLNDQPYARRIEFGSSSMAPDGVYEAVAAVAKNRFGNIARIRFTYRELSTVPAAGPKPGRERSKGKRKRYRADDYRRPAIVVTGF